MKQSSSGLPAGPIIPTPIALASPNVAELFAQTIAIACDGYLVSRLGTDRDSPAWP